MSERKNKKHGVGAGGIIGLSIVYILLGLAMIFFPKINETYIIYAVCAVLIVVGVLMIVRYFMSGSYKDLQAYGFSFGVLAIIGGFCVLIRSQLVADYFGLFLGICILLTAIIKLQNAVDLSSMENRSWILFLILALLFLAASVWIILDPMGMNGESLTYIYYVMVADGAVGIFSSIYMMIATRIYEKWELQGKPERKSDKRRRERKEAIEREKAEREAAAARAAAEAAAAPLSLEEKEEAVWDANTQTYVNEGAAGTDSTSSSGGSSSDSAKSSSASASAGSSSAAASSADSEGNTAAGSAGGSSAAGNTAAADSADSGTDTGSAADNEEEDKTERLLKSIFSGRKK